MCVCNGQRHNLVKASMATVNRLSFINPIEFLLPCYPEFRLVPNPAHSVDLFWGTFDLIGVLDCFGAIVASKTYKYGRASV